jgi:hypothetical protein
MTSNIKRLTALAVAQCGSFVIVLFIGVFGSSGHHATTVHTPTPTPVVHSHTPTPTPVMHTHTPAPTPAATHSTPPSTVSATVTPKPTGQHK